MSISRYKNPISLFNAQNFQQNVNLFIWTLQFQLLIFQSPASYFNFSDFTALFYLAFYRSDIANHWQSMTRNYYLTIIFISKLLLNPLWTALFSNLLVFYLHCMIWLCFMLLLFFHSISFDNYFIYYRLFSFII